MTNAQAEAFLKGFHDELGKNAGIMTGLRGVFGAAKRVLKPGSRQVGTTLGQRAGQFGARAKKFAKRHTGATIGAAGAAGLGAGYMASR